MAMAHDYAHQLGPVGSSGSSGSSRSKKASRQHIALQSSRMIGAAAAHSGDLRVCLYQVRGSTMATWLEDIWLQNVVKHVINGNLPWTKWEYHVICLERCEYIGFPYVECFIQNRLWSVWELDCPTVLSFRGLDTLNKYGKNLPTCVGFCPSTVSPWFGVLFYIWSSCQAFFHEVETYYQQSYILSMYNGFIIA